MESGETTSQFSSSERKYITFAQREVRRVPFTYQHPRDAQGRYISLLGPGQLPYDLDEIQEFIDDGLIQSIEDTKAWCMPDFSDTPEEEMGLCVYETCTEGTPISPIFPSTPRGMFELLVYMTENGTTYGDLTTDIEGWAGILFASDTTSARVDLQSGVLTISNTQNPKSIPNN